MEDSILLQLQLQEEFHMSLFYTSDYFNESINKYIL